MNAYEAKMQASDMCYVCFESRHTGACARANCPQARRVPRKTADFSEEAPATPVSYKQKSVDATEPTVSAPTDRALANHFEKYPGALPDLDQEPPHADEAAYRAQVLNETKFKPGWLQRDGQQATERLAELTAPMQTLLVERQTTHGNFSDNARIAQALRQFFRSEHRGWHQLNWRQAEALDQIAGKLSRILSGQGGFADHWEDIAGYATLAANPEVQ